MTLIICEAAKFCNKTIGFSGLSNECAYKLPYNKKHTFCRHCSYIKSQYLTQSEGYYDSYQMQFVEYVHGKTVLPNSLAELDKGRKNNHG